jgi:metal-responsive CopG/Arc/MetJ family transcriptional regulator
MAKVLVSFDDKLLKRIDRAAGASGRTRSGYLSWLAETQVGRESGPGKQPAARKAMGRLDRLFADAPAGDSTEAVRAERDAR